MKLFFGLVPLLLILSFFTPANAQTLNVTTTAAQSRIAQTSSGLTSAAKICNTGAQTAYTTIENFPNGATPGTIPVTTSSYPILSNGCVNFASLYGDTWIAYITGAGTTTLTYVINTQTAILSSIAMLANGANAILPDARNAILGPNFVVDNSGNTTVAGALSVAGAATLSNGLTVTNTTTLNNALTVAGVANFNSILKANDGLTVTGSFTLNNNLSVGGNSTVTGTSSFTGASTFNGGETVNGTAAFVNGVSFNNTANAAFQVAGQSLFARGIGITDSNPSLSSYDPQYFTTYTNQLAGSTNKESLSGPVSDTNGSFRDGAYFSLHDSDGTVYTQQHSDFGIRVGAFGPYASGDYTTVYKNIIGLSGYAFANNPSTLVQGVATGVEGVTGEAYQYGAGIVDNEFAVHNPSAANGGTAQSISMAALQGITDYSYAAPDSSHTAYGFLITNIGSQPITAAFAANGGTHYNAVLDGTNATVNNYGIIMPQSSSAYNGTIINYGLANGGAVSYTMWNGGKNGGQYQFVDAGVTVGTVDTLGIGSKSFIKTVANNGTTGTTVNTLAKISTNGTAIITATTDTDGADGLVVAGAGTTGSASIAFAGIASCVFDGATTAGDYVTYSSTTAGNCHDTGSTTRPTHGVGKVLTTNGSGGTYAVDLQIF